ncbi:MAG TPA: hypothetical protein VFN42_11675 [Acetobacteraceae bacterium]|nr:hypothetical protein [Acetobacteraceae bacterium]
MHSDADAALTPEQMLDFRRLAGLMIPPDQGLGLPGADDAAIFADIVRSLGRDADHVRTALTHLAALAGGSFAECDAATRDSIAATLLAGDGPEIAALGRAVLQCYYRDDRVMQSLGLEPRPPFPKGHTIEQGDWSLLDVVRARPKMWRDAP